MYLELSNDQAYAVLIEVEDISTVKEYVYAHSVPSEDNSDVMETVTIVTTEISMKNGTTHHVSHGFYDKIKNYLKRKNKVIDYDQL